LLGHKQNLNINKILIKFFILIVAISSSVESVSAKEFRGIHYTTLLPIITNLDVTIHDQVFKNMEKGLVGYKSVKYKSNAGLFNILNKDKAKLRENLYTDAVIKTVGKRLLVGSIIRVEINSFLMGYEVTFDVLSSDGENMFHRKKTTYQKSVKLLNSLLHFWIKGYIDTFPYDATIEGVQVAKAFIDFPG